jgi:hypothetical protein
MSTPHKKETVPFLPILSRLISLILAHFHPICAAFPGHNRRQHVYIACVRSRPLQKFLLDFALSCFGLLL